MSDLLKDYTKSVLEKMNLFVVLQIAWIIEFHILAIFSAKDWFHGMPDESWKEPTKIVEYGQKIANWMDTYKDFIFFTGIILIMVGISAAFFKLISVSNKYKIIYTYSNLFFCWLLVSFDAFHI